MKEAMLKTKEAAELHEEAEVVEMTVEEARDLVDQIPESAEFLSLALDKAQGDVFTDQKSATYVVIRIVKEHGA
jgi:hypothetical protein